MIVSFSAAKDTLAYQLGARPLTRMIDFSHVPTKEVMAQFKDTLSPKTVKPESDALWFYLLNHAVSKVREIKQPHEPLGPYAWILDEYHAKLVDRAIRAYRYMMLIVTREARHGSMAGISALKWQECVPIAGPVAVDYVQHKIMGASGSEEGAIGNLQNNPPNCTIGQYVAAIKFLFNNGKWSNGHTAYGGIKWGAVTECLENFISGKYSAEMMLDIVWTLCHNGGPIFNKGMLYDMYNGSALKAILDVQRSGQIPHMIAEGNQYVVNYVSPELISIMQKVAAQIPDFIDKPYVDWFRVEALGGQYKWPTEKALQVKKYGEPNDPLWKEKVAAMKAKAEADAKALAEKKAMQWELYPEVTLQKFKPVRQKAEVAA